MLMRTVDMASNVLYIAATPMARKSIAREAPAMYTLSTDLVYASSLVTTDPAIGLCPRSVPNRAHVHSAGGQHGDDVVGAPGRVRRCACAAVVTYTANCAVIDIAGNPMQCNAFPCPLRCLQSQPLDPAGDPVPLRASDVRRIRDHGLRLCGPLPRLHLPPACRPGPRAIPFGPEI